MQEDEDRRHDSVRPAAAQQGDTQKREKGRQARRQQTGRTVAPGGSWGKK